MIDPHNVLVAPILTEKTNILRENKRKVYVFKVDPRANKAQVEEAVEKLFGLKPIATRILVYKGKPKRYLGRGRGFGQTSRVKKAYVTLAENQKIDKFEGV